MCCYTWRVAERQWTRGSIKYELDRPRVNLLLSSLGVLPRTTRKNTQEIGASPPKPAGIFSTATKAIEPQPVSKTTYSLPSRQRPDADLGAGAGRGSEKLCHDNMLNGLLAMSGLRGLRGNANRSSSTPSGWVPGTGAGGGAPEPTKASSEAMAVPFLASDGSARVARGGAGLPRASERVVARDCMRGWALLDAAASG